MAQPTTTHSIIYRSFLCVLCCFLFQACGGSEDNTPKYSISADIKAASFSNQLLNESTDTVAVNVTFEGNGLLIGYPPESTPVNWLSFRTENVTPTSSTIHIDIINAEFQLANLHKTVIRLSTGDVDTNELVHHDIDVSLFIWQLISFNDTLGATEIVAQSFNIDNPNNDLSFSVDVDWLNVESVLEDDISTVTVSTTLDNISQAGLYKGNITLSDSFGESVMSVELGLDNLYLFADKENIAFSSTANTEYIEQIITLNSNSPAIKQWQASADVDWLTLTPITESNQLKINVLPNVSAANSLAQGTISISALGKNTADDKEFSIISETINVSLYNSNIAAEQKTLSDLTVNSNALVAAPLLPYFYIATKNTLHVYHQYSGDLLKELVVAPDESLLEQLVIHPDGQTLLAQSTETIVNEDLSESTLIHRYKINLADMDNLIFEELSDFDIQFNPMGFTRFSGRYYVVSQALEFADENLKTQYWDQANAYFVQAIDMAEQAQSLFVLSNNDSNINRYKVKVNDFAENVISAELTHQYRPESLSSRQSVSNFFVSGDEKNIYLMSPTSEWVTFTNDPSDGVNFVDKGLLNASDDIISLDLLKSKKDLPYFSSFDPSLGFTVNMYDSQHTLETTVFIGENQPQNIQLSSDNQRLLITTPSNNSVEIMNLEPYVEPEE